MTTIYLKQSDKKIEIATRLPFFESAAIGDVYDSVSPGESFGGLTYEELRNFAITCGQVDSDELKEL